MLLKHTVLRIEEKILNLLIYPSNCKQKKKKNTKTPFPSIPSWKWCMSNSWFIKILDFYSIDKSHYLENNGQKLKGW
jgi:hypothetical protein